jgi:hypothetical protein
MDRLGERLLSCPPNLGMVYKVLFDETRKEALFVEVAKVEAGWADIGQQREHFGCWVCQVPHW